MAEPEQALRERVVAAVEVAEHDQEVAARDRVGARPRRSGGRRSGSSSRARPASSRRRRRRDLAGERPAALQLALLVAHLVPEPEARAHQRAELRRERARAVRDLAQQLGAAVEHAPAPPARGVQHRRQRRAQLVEHRGAERHVEVAHAVQVGDRAPAAAVARRRARPRGRRPPRTRGRGGRARRRRPRAARRRRRRARPRAGRGRRVGEQRRSVRSGNGPIGSGVDSRRRPPRPRSPTSRSARRARAPARPSAPRSPSAERAPRERPEEADRVVLGAVALPVAGDDVVQRRRRDGLPGAPAASLSTARASDSRLCHATASRNAGSRATSASRASSSGPERVEPLDREAGAADGEVAPQAPVLGELDLVVEPDRFRRDIH